jgi:carboxy-terminal domain RNA polymerase II polypeptide A small phosphatase
MLLEAKVVWAPACARATLTSSLSPYGALAPMRPVAEQHYDFAVWSSASAPYVSEVAAHLFGDRFRLKFISSVERCIQRVDIRSNGYGYIKHLRKVQGQGYGLDQITMLDDSPEKISRQPRNHLKVSPYFGNPNDNALADIAKVLAACHDVNEPGSLPGD